jgi:mRNA-degrading endonuclease YafQ of YafQ-DinJ toxin-antitoxin module
MIEIRYAPTFVRMYAKLSPALKSEAKEKISLFQDKTHHTRLKVHKLTGELEGTFSFSVNYRTRIIFEYEGGERANLLLIGSHDDVY